MEVLIVWFTVLPRKQYHAFIAALTSLVIVPIDSVPCHITIVHFPFDMRVLTKRKSKKYASDCQYGYLKP